MFLTVFRGVFLATITPPIAAKKKMASSSSSWMNQVWKFMVDNKCTNVNAEELQERPGMWYRKAAIATAMNRGRPDAAILAATVMSTDEQCISDAMAVLRARWSRAQIEAWGKQQDVPLQAIQNSTHGMVWRKRISREAITRLVAETKESTSGKTTVAFEAPNPIARTLFGSGGQQLDGYGKPATASSSTLPQLTHLCENLGVASDRFKPHDVAWLRKIGRCRALLQ
jgi:hypothetical protein